MGVGKIVMRSKENLILIEPREGVLIAYSLYYQEELRGIIRTHPQTGVHQEGR